MRRIGMIVAAAAAVPTLVAGPTVAAAAPASADAYPTLNFLIKDGTGGYYSGTVTFYNRSVGVIGSFNASGCERAYATSLVDLKALDARSTSLHCDTVTSGSFPFPRTFLVGRIASTSPSKASMGGCTTSRIAGVRP